LRLPGDVWWHRLWVSSVFKIPPEFRAFMREVAAKVDFGEIGTAVGDNALEHECGRGGRIEHGSQVYRFTYLEKGGWEIELREEQIRDIASGLIVEIEALQLAEGTRANRGDALVVWGEYNEDGLRVRSLTDLGAVLDGMAAASLATPCLIRLWGTSDQQAVAALNGLEAAIYVVASEQGYGRSVGDPTRSETFRINDHDVGVVDIPWSDVIPWRIARDALLRFAEHGNLGDQVILDGSIPTTFLMLGDYDRAAELVSRRPPPTDPAQSSLPHKAPQGEWAKRLLKSLIEFQLVEIDMQIVDAIMARLTILLIIRGDDALDSPEAAQGLAKEIERIRGVGALFATGGDLQIALRRTQEPATQPVETPFAK
jgi:hypothetical protein